MTIAFPPPGRVLGKAEPSRADGIRVDNATKTFRLRGSYIPALDNVSLTASAGEFVAVVGASGSGKTTLLRLIAGLERPDTGSIAINGRAVSEPSLDCGVVFQDHRLLPWLTVTDNVASALIAKGLGRIERREQALAYVNLVGLGGFEDAYPRQLSGGMAQRTALARALVNEPSVLLMDEPFGALDALTRLRMQTEVEHYCRSVGRTVLLITHDIEEAVFLADRVVVLSSRPGRIKRIVTIDLERPRRRESHEFVELRRDVLSDFS